LPGQQEHSGVGDDWYGSVQKGEGMPRYYFDVINGHGLERDDNGQDLSSDTEIRREVTRILTDIAKDEITYADAANIRVNVRDRNGLQVHYGEISFRSGSD
jgi:hypothetical protein